jgi:nicotinate-nucleotide pyrophosphorylase (carboxylating)
MKHPGPLPPRSTWEWLVDAALAEDLGAGDATPRAVIAPEATGRAELVARDELVVAGLGIAGAVFERCGARLTATSDDGKRLAAGGCIAEIEGPTAAILSGERTALNFLQRLCGVATNTARYCARVQGSAAQIVDTRKTTPGWRALEKYAVRCGGGANHRMGLFDGILIKDNHIAAVGSVRCAVALARERAPFGLKVQVEVESLEQVHEALEARADALLIDNQPPRRVAEIVRIVAGRAALEASGGIHLDNVGEYAATGVDRISIGALTHSAPAADISLEWTESSSR